MSSDSFLLDTNVLVGSLLVDDYRYPAARPLMEQAQNIDADFCIVPQILAEFYAVITNPKLVNDVKTAPEAIAAVRSFLALPGLTLLPTPVDIVNRWTNLLEQHPVTGRRFFDVQIIAAMLGNGVKNIYTFNVKDFAPFADIAAITVIEPTPPKGDDAR